MKIFWKITKMVNFSSMFQSIFHDDPDDNVKENLLKE